MAEDPADREFIREGMSVGVVLVKICKPDSESVGTGGGATVAAKRSSSFRRQPPASPEADRSSHSAVSGSSLS
jgi:hypothetical protein